MTPSVFDSPDWLALVAGIRAHPEADLPRLVAADWLDEHGEEYRAQHIRLSIEWGETGECGWTLQPHVHAYECLEPFRLNGVPHTHYLYRRGFVDEIVCPDRWWTGEVCEACDGTGRDAGLADDDWSCKACSRTGFVGCHGADLVAAHPVSRVTLTNCRPGLNTSTAGVRWTLRPRHLERLEHDLPPGAFIRLRRGRRDPDTVWYDANDGTAETDASDAMIEFAKAVASLRR